MPKALDEQAAITLFVASSPLRYPVYGDGLALRAEHLQVEQDALRALLALGAAGEGPRVVRGLEVEGRGKHWIVLRPGLAVDARGQPLLLPRVRRLSLDRLLARSATTTAPCEVARLYLLTARHAEGPRGEAPEVVQVEGLELRVEPLPLAAPLPVSRTVPLDERHLRSRAAAAVFAGQRPRGLVSAAGLAQATWCLGAAETSGDDVPLAVLGWTAGGLAFVDPWIVRRESCDEAPRRTWSALLGHRSWDLFLAEVLQFQCQLADSLRADPEEAPDPDGTLRATLLEARAYAQKLRTLGREEPAKATPYLVRDQILVRAGRKPLLPGGVTGLLQLQSQIQGTLHAIRPQPGASSLLERGIVALPPAGYLPVEAGGKAPSVNEQVRKWMGEGVDLRFCIVRPDFVPHALEEACHLDRISLLDGLDDARRKPAVDVLVPDGTLRALEPPAGLFEAGLGIGFGRLSGAFRGTARRETVGEDGAAFHLGGFGAAPFLDQMLFVLVRAFASAEATEAEAAPAEAVRDRTLTGSFLLRGLSLAGRDDVETGPDERGLWMTMRTERAVSGLQPYESTRVSGRAILGAAAKGKPLALELVLQGDITALDRTDTDEGVEVDASLAFVVTAATIAPTGAVAHEVAHSRRLTIGLRVRAKGDARDGSTEVDVFQETLAPRQVTTELRHTWDATGRERVTVGLAQAYSVFERGPLPPLAELGLTPNPDVRRPEHPFHALAESGLNVIARALQGEPTFKDAALRALYPPPAPPEPLIEATKDWVFFHRRRQARRLPAERLPARPSTRYRLFELAAEGEAERKRALEQLASNDRRRQQALRAELETDLSLTVSFSGTDLLDDAHELRRAWRAARPGRRIVQAIAATTSHDGPWAQEMRLRRVVETLTGRSAAGVTLRVLPRVPAALAQFQAEGSLLLVTRVARACQFVYGVAAEAWPDLRRRLEDPAATTDALTEALESAIATGSANRLGRVDFFADSTRAAEGDAAVAEFYAKAFPDRLPVAAWSWTTAFVTEDDRRLESARAVELTRLLGGAAKASALTPRVELPTECDAVTVVVAGG